MKDETEAGEAEIALEARTETFAIGDEVTLSARVVGVVKDDRWPVEHRTVRVQTPDGQGIETNVRNVKHVKQISGPAEDKALHGPSEAKSAKPEKGTDGSLGSSLRKALSGSGSDS